MSAVMPSQWADTFRSEPYVPERMLWLCVLEDAIRCVQGCEVGAPRCAMHVRPTPASVRGW